MKKETKLNYKIIKLEQITESRFYVSKFDTERQSETEKIIVSNPELANEIYTDMINIEFSKLSYQF